MESYEQRVRVFYDSALHCYQAIMGDRWHHADPDALAAGLPRLRGCEILEERIVSLLGIQAGARVLDFGSGIGGPTLHMARTTSATFFESVCHVPDKAALFRELARVVKPGGRLGGMDWIQRPFGEHQTDAAIEALMQPVNDAISIPWHGTVERYRDLMTDAGFAVKIARDLYPNVRCWSPVQDDETPAWATYTGPEQQMFRRGEEALANARRAGVFTIGMWIATRR